MASYQLKRPTHLVLDFDGTLTVKDTMAVLGELPKDPKMTWEQISAAYMEDYSSHKNEPYPWKNYDRKEYSGWLESRKWVEAASARRVQEAGFFRGVKFDDVQQSVARSLENGNIELRDGWVKLFELFLPLHDETSGLLQGGGLSIISVNWSETAIRQALWQSAMQLDHPAKKALLSLINDIPIYANEIEGLSSPLGSSGRVCRPLDMDIRTSADKLKYLPHARGAYGGVAPFVFYVGDSSTDFDALCAADVGIWSCDVPELQYGTTFKEMFKPLEFLPPPLSSWPGDGDQKQLFYWAPDFNTVLKALAREQGEGNGTG